MGRKSLLFWSFIILFALSSTFLGGCRKGAEKKPAPSQGKQETSQKPKEPKELTAINKEIESILKETEKKLALQDKTVGAASQNKQDQESKTSSQPGDKKQESQQKKEEKKSPEKTLQDWSKEEKAMENIHKKWNSLETSAVKAGAADSLIEAFETDLDRLTGEIMKKSILGTRNAANELYGNSTKIAKLYQTNNPPDVDMMKYFTRKSLLNMEEDQWEGARKSVQDLETQWDKVKPMMDEKTAKLIAPTDYSIHDFARSIEQKNKDVAQIKGEIVLTNIDRLTKEIQKAQQK
ncbi:hypothetical protein [Candidatus Formimonas warabiya]|uniref:Uncharacterized protein n=1 Tax=Formimonas warabiya TaxID=1761012 RepID=A0A3G1KQT1_FORW1|nr:hypothetical protein [Candidatus Formimonas warabiya]ATW24823.1 hypothetical protein DCMF_08585 [Candidatus Formimonas warabiya]